MVCDGNHMRILSHLPLSGSLSLNVLEAFPKCPRIFLLSHALMRRRSWYNQVRRSQLENSGCQSAEASCISVASDVRKGHALSEGTGKTLHALLSVLAHNEPVTILQGDHPSPTIYISSRSGSLRFVLLAIYGVTWHPTIANLSTRIRMDGTGC